MWKVIVLTVLAFGLYDQLKDGYFGSLYGYFKSLSGEASWSFFLTYASFGIPIFLAVLLLHPARQFWSSLGLHQSFPKAILVTLIWTLPMLVGYAIVFEWNDAITWTTIFKSAICAALFEELYYRGFLFGQLFRFTRIGFIPSILVGALLFAAAHLYQSQNIGTMIGIFAMTFMGAFLFAWVYIEWDNNLWVPIFLHLFMNLFWMLFAAGENALGGLYSNIFRVLTITLVISGTIWYKKRNGLPLAIDKHTIWMKKQSTSYGFN
ncbi:MAG: CPBP family intramembrane glutamic endopeptidase [Bacteroidota bacterium]